MKAIRFLALILILCLLAVPASAARYDLEDGRFFILSLGGSFAYSRDTTGTFRVWGDNQYGQLGKGHFNNAGGILGIYPAEFKTKNQDLNMSQVRDVVCGSNYSFLWMEDGTLYAIGNSERT